MRHPLLFSALPLHSFTLPVPAFPAPVVSLSLDFTHDVGHVLNCLFGAEDSLVEIWLRLVA